MLLERLPLELVQQIIKLVVDNDRLKDITALMGVSKILETETMSLFQRMIEDFNSDTARWGCVPFPVRRRIARDTIISKPDPGCRRNIATYMHAVSDYLSRYSKEFDPSDTGLLSGEQWLNEISDVLAPSAADCKCGKPAFMHLRCYSLAKVPDTAFHVAILKGHTKLEMVMIEEGRSADSVCPYLKVSKRDPLFTRRNALEWACAYGLEDTIYRLVDTAEKKGMEQKDYIPTAAAIYAVTNTKGDPGKTLRILLERLDNSLVDVALWSPTLQYQNRAITFHEWNRLMLFELAKHKKLYNISVVRTLFPYFECWTESSLWPRNFCQRDYTRNLISKERPYCDILPWESVGGYRWHWLHCDSSVCHNRYSKANPICDRCNRNHVKDENWRDFYDYNGYPLHPKIHG